jgi:hypothetical protein
MSPTSPHVRARIPRSRHHFAWCPGRPLASSSRTGRHSHARGDVYASRTSSNWRSVTFSLFRRKRRKPRSLTRLRDGQRPSPKAVACPAEAWPKLPSPMVESEISTHTIRMARRERAPTRTVHPATPLASAHASYGKTPAQGMVRYASIRSGWGSNRHDHLRAELATQRRAISSAGERPPHTREVVGSNPTLPTTLPKPQRFYLETATFYVPDR